MPRYEIEDQSTHSTITLFRGSPEVAEIFWGLGKDETQIEVRDGYLFIYQKELQIIPKIPRAYITVPSSTSDEDLFNKLAFMVEGGGGAGGTVTSITAGTGLDASPANPITGAGTINLADTAVTPGTYRYARVTVDQQGRITDIAEGEEPNRKTKVIDIVDNTAAPPTEVAGDRYILDTTGVTNPAWDGAAQNDIVQFDGTVWVAETPQEGWTTLVDLEDKDAVFVDDGTPQWELRSNGLAAQTFTQIWVDATNGSDVTGTVYRRDRPFATIHTAVAAAAVGDTVIVLAGLYQYATGGITDPGNLRFVKAGVTVDCQRGVEIFYNSTINGGSDFWNDDGVAGTYRFVGHAYWNDLRDQNLRTIMANNIATDMELQFDRISGSVRCAPNLFKRFKCTIREDDTPAQRLSMRPPAALDDIYFEWNCEQFAKGAGNFTPLEYNPAGAFTCTNSTFVFNFGDMTHEFLFGLFGAILFGRLGAGCNIVFNAKSFVDTSVAGVNAPIFTFFNCTGCSMDFKINGMLHGGRILSTFGSNDVKGICEVQGEIRDVTTFTVDLAGFPNSSFTLFFNKVHYNVPSSSAPFIDTKGGVAVKEVTIKGAVKHTGDGTNQAIQNAGVGLFHSKYQDLDVETNAPVLMAVGTQVPDIDARSVRSNTLSAAGAINYVAGGEVIQYVPSLTVEV